MKKIKDILSFYDCFIELFAIVILALLAIIIGIVWNLFLLTIVGVIVLELLIFHNFNTTSLFLIAFFSWISSTLWIYSWICGVGMNIESIGLMMAIIIFLLGLLNKFFLNR